MRTSKKDLSGKDLGRIITWHQIKIQTTYDFLSLAFHLRQGLSQSLSILICKVRQILSVSPVSLAIVRIKQHNTCEEHLGNLKARTAVRRCWVRRGAF